MTDVFTKKKRSEVMSKIRSKNTTVELLLKCVLDGRIFRHQPKGIIGNPDFASKKWKIAIFVDGCFWHGCPSCYKAPKSNKVYWVNKIRRNKERDKKINKNLHLLGWKTVRVWEHSIIESPDKYKEKIKKIYEESINEKGQ